MTTATPPDERAVPPEVQAELDDRYGRRPAARRRRAGWILTGVLAVAAVGYLGWTTVAQSIDAVDVDTTAFRLDDAHSVTIDFQVTLTRGAAVTCAIEAQDTEHGVVGWRVVSYPADDAHTRSFTETIPTVAEATTGLATSCWIP